MGKKDLYNYFTAAGLTHAGALGLLGNLQAESGCESCRLQGDFDLTRSRSKAYAARVDSGEMSIHVMANDQAGWGLAQWSYWSRKEALFYFCRGRGASIADEMSQAQFIMKELREDYSQLLKFLCSTNEMFTATKKCARSTSAQRSTIFKPALQWQKASSLSCLLKPSQKRKTTGLLARLTKI